MSQPCRDCILTTVDERHVGNVDTLMVRDNMLHAWHDGGFIYAQLAQFLFVVVNAFFRLHPAWMMY